jgi:uncharacterized protein (UPF0216 family)
MGWTTDLFCNISFNRETFNYKEEVESKISELDKCIESCKNTIRDMALITEPAKFINKEEDSNPYYFVINNVEDNIQLLEEYTIERFKLLLLLDNWDSSHTKEGLAIYPPDNIEWNSAFMSGDFVKSTKFPEINTL